MTTPADDYNALLAREAQHWGDRLAVETIHRYAWLDHPAINRHYHERGLVDGMPWEAWVSSRLGGPAERSYELGCGSAQRSLKLFDSGRTRHVEGVDVSPDRVAAGEHDRLARRAAGQFVVADVNTLRLPPEAFDLIFSCHSFHHFQALETVMEQVHSALSPRGVFVLEEFVGPTQFQWTDQQIEVVKSLTALLPERLRMLRWGAVKPFEGRPTPAEVVAVSPFESIRSSEIVPLFERYFDIVAIRRQGGTLQHLLYNGIIHNFADDDAEANAYLRAIWQVEDALIDAHLLPSDFQLLIGQRRDAVRAAS